MTFEVGDVVVCIDARNIIPGRIVSGTLEEGRRYTVRGMDFSPFCRVPGLSGVFLVEVIQAISEIAGSEYSFKAERFRKITGPCELQRVEQMRRETVGA